MVEIQGVNLPEFSEAFNDASGTLDERMLAAMSQLVTDNNQLRTDATTSMHKAAVNNSPGDMLKALTLLGDHKIHTETLLAWAREINKGIETLIKA